MRVILSNGASYPISAYETPSVKLDGDNTKGIKLQFTDITESAIRELLSDMGNFAAIELYSDKNIFINEYSGYQVKVSVELGDGENAYAVTLAQGTDTTAKVNALAKDVNKMTEAVADALKTISDATKQIGEVTPKLSALTEDYRRMQTENTEMETKVTAMTDAFTQMTNALDTATNGITAVHEREHELNETINRVISENTSLSQSASDLIQQVRVIAQNTDELNATYQSKIGNLSRIEETVEEAKTLATKNDEGIQLQKEDIKKMSTTVEEKVNNYEKKITEQSKTLTEHGEKVETAVRTAENVEARVAALEPVTDITTLSLDEAKKYRVDESKQKLETFLENNPIISSCHGEEAFYSITSEKQSYLQAMILMATTAVANGIEYTPSWNAMGEPCTYDWTIPQLQQLAMEIEVRVRPLVSQQQVIDKDIRAAKTMDELKELNIEYHLADMPLPAVPQPTDPSVTPSEGTGDEEEV